MQTMGMTMDDAGKRKSSNKNWRTRLLLNKRRATTAVENAYFQASGGACTTLYDDACGVNEETLLSAFGAVEKLDNACGGMRRTQWSPFLKDGGASSQKAACAKVFADLRREAAFCNGDATADQR